MDTLVPPPPPPTAPPEETGSKKEPETEVERLRRLLAEMTLLSDRNSLEAKKEKERADREARLRRLENLRDLHMTSIPALQPGSRVSSSVASQVASFTQLPVDAGDGLATVLSHIPALAAEEGICHDVVVAMSSVARPDASADEVAAHHPFGKRVIDCIEVAARKRGCDSLKGHAEASLDTRRPDISFTRRVEQRVLPSNLCTLVEMKAGSRGKQNPHSLMREAVSQVINYLTLRQLSCDDVPTVGVGCAIVGSNTVLIVRMDFADAGVPITVTQPLALLPSAPADVGDDVTLLPGLRALVRLLTCTDAAVHGLGPLARPETPPGYEFVRLLGSGGFADVALLKTGDGVEVAAKYMRVENEGAVRMYLRAEQRVLDALAGACARHIPRVHHFGGEQLYVRDGRHVLLLQPVGRPLSEALPSDLEAGARYVLAGHLLQHVCTALAAAHGKGITHGDVRPINVVATPGLGGGWDFVLIDWGLATGGGVATRPKLHGDRAFMSERLISEGAKGVAVEEDDDKEAALWTFFAFALGFGSGSAPWGGATFLEAMGLKQVRRAWVLDNVLQLEAACDAITDATLREWVRARITRLCGA